MGTLWPLSDSEAHGKSRADLKRLIKDAALAPCRRHTNATGTTTTRVYGKGIRITTVLRAPLIPPSRTNLTHFLPISRTTQTKDHHAFHPTKEQPLTIHQYQVRQVLQNNIRKAAGPDGVSGQILKTCSNQQATVPTCLKTATVISSQDLSSH